MDCPKCGKQIKDGQLYCEECGHEIRIVPDFDPEVEMQITETLTNLAGDLEEKAETDLEPKADTFLGRLRENEHFVTMTTVVVSLFVVISIFAGISTYQHNSYNYQITQALSYERKEEYDKAIPYMERALTISSGDKGAELLLADYYYKNGDHENAVAVLKGYIESAENPVDGYRKLIFIYEEEEMYQEINALLEECGDEEVLTQFQEFAAHPPLFSMDPGTYYELMPLKLSANTTGTIYYTLDGTRPTERSEEYTAPIFLDIGSYSVKAIFINSYGIVSEEAMGSYIIDVTAPYPPEVNLYSNLYVTPQMIEAVVPPGDQVYYTMDGKDPTQDSLLYTGGIQMPLGNSHFKFVTYNKEGASGEITERKYNLVLKDAAIQTQDAINIATFFLYESGFLLDVQGHAENVSGQYIYSCHTAIQSGEQIYYLVIESYLDTMGTQTKTGKQFAVGAMDGIVYSAEQGAPGEYVIKTF